MGTEHGDHRRPYLLELVRLTQETLRESSRWYPRATLEVVDAAGCILRGADHPMVRRLAASRVPEQPEGGPFPTIAVQEFAPLEHALLVDSLACHVDEFDSLHPGSATVPAAVVVPTALCLSAWLGASGTRLLDAVICGYDVLTSVARRYGGASLYHRSWWPTSTFGSLGAAATAGVLLGLDEDAFAHALGIAATSVGGLLSADRLSEGHYLSGAQAAVYGAVAALRARAGMEASWTLLDGPASRALGGVADAVSTPGAGSVDDCVVKWYPCARPLHGVVEGLLELRRSGVDLRSVATLEVALKPDLLEFVSADTLVKGPTEAAASAAFALSAVVLGRESDPSFFRRAQFAWLGPAPRVTLVPEPAGVGTWAAKLTCTTRSGALFEVDGKPDERTDPQRVQSKFVANASASGTSKATTGELLTTMLDLPSAMDAGTLVRALLER